MTVIYRGRRYFVLDDELKSGGLELMIDGNPSARVRVALDDPDLVLAPTPEDLHLAEAFERGEISAFEYVDGPTPGIRRSRRHESAKPRLESTEVSTIVGCC